MRIVGIEGVPARLGVGLDLGPRVLRGIPVNMLIVHVHVRVKPEGVAAFLEATRANAAASVQERGIARFDVMQQLDDPTQFVLVEAYRNAEAPVLHKETAHYAAWREAVAPLMAEPRRSVKYTSAFPAETAG